MTIKEKRVSIKNIIDKLPENALDEVLYSLQDLTMQNENRKKILQELLASEIGLFQKLAK